MAGLSNLKKGAGPGQFTQPKLAEGAVQAQPRLPRMHLTTALQGGGGGGSIQYSNSEAPLTAKTSDDCTRPSVPGSFDGGQSN